MNDPAKLPSAYLVVMDQGGLFGAYLDEDLANRKAAAIGAVVVTAPITADYRERPSDTPGR